MAAIDKSLYEKMTITAVSGDKTADIKTGVIKKPPPIPKSPDIKPTMKLRSKITKILT